MFLAQFYTPNFWQFFYFILYNYHYFNVVLFFNLYQFHWIYEEVHLIVIMINYYTLVFFWLNNYHQYPGSINTPFWVWRFVKYFTMHVVAKKHFYKFWSFLFRITRKSWINYSAVLVDIKSRTVWTLS